MSAVTPIKGNHHSHGGSSQRGLVVFRAYFDDSGTSSDPVVIWAGYMASETDWQMIEKEWNEKLLRYGIGWFHSVDIENNQGEAARLTANVRDAAQREFSHLMSTSGAVGIASSVRLADWDAVPDERLRANFPHPAHLCFEHCMQMALDLSCGWSHFIGKIEQVRLMFDCGAAENRHGAVGYDIARQYERNWVHSPWFRELTFGSVRNEPALQAADLLAYETNKLEIMRLKNNKEPVLRAPLGIQLKNPAVRGQRYGIAELKALCEQLSWGHPPDLLAPFRLSP